jgi:hypothetical protein
MEAMIKLKMFIVNERWPPLGGTHSDISYSSHRVITVFVLCLKKDFCLLGMSLLPPETAIAMKKLIKHWTY